MPLFERTREGVDRLLGQSLKRRDEKAEIVLSRRPLSSHSHQLRPALVFSHFIELGDAEELRFELSVIVSYQTIRCWRDRLGAGFCSPVNQGAARRAARGASTRCSSRSRVELYPLWRAVGGHGVEPGLCFKAAR